MGRREGARAVIVSEGPPAPKISDRLGRIPESATATMGMKLIALRQQGVHVSNLAIGELDLDTPVHIREAAKAAMDSGATRYTAVGGRRDLREAVAAWLEAHHGLPLGPEEVMVSAGSKQVLYNLFHALLDAGDEVVIPTPCWTSYPDIVALAGGRPVRVWCEADAGFVPDVERVTAAMTDRTAALMIPTPTNPTGAVYPEPVVRSLVEACARRGVTVVTDDIYRSFVYGAAEAISVPRLAREAGAPFVLVDGVSKTYAMTGWRVGFGAAHPAFIKAMTVLQSQSTTCASSISQAAALAAIAGPQTCVEETLAELARRREALLGHLRRLPGVELSVEPAGAFYALPSVRAWRGARTPDGRELEDDVALVGYLLDDAHVALTAGTWFEAPGFLRFSYATSLDEIEAAMPRVAASMAKLVAPERQA